MVKTDYDYIVIGSGIAGLNAALLAREHGSVLVLTKGKIDDCNTRYAQGGIAAAIGQGDSPLLHMQDTLSAGAGLCDPEAVQVLTQEGPQRVADLIQWGVPFDTIHGQINLGREGAHSLPRILHAGGDATGQHIELTLAGLVRQSAITVLEYSIVTRLIVDKGAMKAVEALDTATGQPQIFTGRFIILATGGAGQLYRYTTNPEVATGDGVALAFLAGAQVMDMEFYQFHPTALRLEGAPTFLLSEAMRGEGAVLRDRTGRAFMADYHPLADLAPRDVVARAMAAEMEKSGNGPVFLDISHLAPDTVKSRFPTIYKFCLGYGLDITRAPAPVAPAAHYMMGGVKADTWGRTNLQGLYACGEVACSGVHGANRLASNSLLETLVFAQRLVASTLRDGEIPPVPPFGLQDTDVGAYGNTPLQSESGSTKPEASMVDGGILAQGRDLMVTLRPKPISCAPAPAPSRSALQDLMWRCVGISRHSSRLIWASRTLYLWERTLPAATDRTSNELRNMVLLGRLMVEAALVRQESRGSHFREDFPQTSPDWGKHIILVKEEDGE